MATNFRLAYLNGTEFVDLFPKTSIGGITDATKALKFVTIQTTIPATTDMTQTITISTQTGMENAWVEMRLIGNSQQEIDDYATITQYEIQPNQLIITRLGSMPVGEIQVNLIFYMQGVE